MKKQVFALLSGLVMSVSALAVDSLGLPTNEDVVTTVLQSSQLSNEKASNAYLASMPLKSINIEAQKDVMVVFLTYSSGGAPCSVRAEVTGSNAVPAGAQGFGTSLSVTSLRSACAVN